jgi:hypothetical protein
MSPINVVVSINPRVGGHRATGDPKAQLSPIWEFILTLTKEKPAEIREENGDLVFRALYELPGPGVVGIMEN